MNLSQPFIRRPVATTLLTIGLVVAGVLAWLLLPIAPLPKVELATIQVTAVLPGASPESVAATVATPLERALGNIAGVTEMTSQSSIGVTRITVQFDLARHIDSAARDVQAAINATRALLPADMPSTPSYRKVNPVDGPVMVLSLTSDTLDARALYEAASTSLSQRLSQVEGIGQVSIGGGALPAVRIAVDPQRLGSSGLSLDEVRAAVSAAGIERPKGAVEAGSRQWQVGANDRTESAADFAPLVLAWRAGAAVRLQDVASVSDSVQDVRNYGAVNGKRAVVLVLSRAPGANVVEAVDRVHALMPVLRASIPPEIDLQISSDRTPMIRAALHEVNHALVLAVVLVILVVLVFLRSWRAALMPMVAVPAALAGTFAVMWLMGLSINNLSLMAMTVAAGLVVDDAIVVVENIMRHLDRGRPLADAVLHGSGEIVFTLVAISAALVSVFIPILFLDGLIGRLFSEFALVIVAAVFVSMVVCLTVTPMMAMLLLRVPAPAQVARPRWRIERWGRAVSRALSRGYRRALRWTLRWQPVALAVLAGTLGLTVWMYLDAPKGFFPQQDTGVINGVVLADQSNSFQAVRQKLDQAVAILQKDPAVASVGGFTGLFSRNLVSLFIRLKQRPERTDSMEEVLERLRKSTSVLAGSQVYLVPAQDLRIGGRQSHAEYQFTLQTDSLEKLREWEPKLRRAMAKSPFLAEVVTDQQDRGLQTTLDIDRDAAARLGVSMRNIDNALANAFSQRQIGVIFNPLNQYRVVMEYEAPYLESSESIARVMLKSNTGGPVPLTAVAKFATGPSELLVTHDNGTPSATISFNLPGGVALSQAIVAVEDTMDDLGIPDTFQKKFQGAAAALEATLKQMPWLILAAIVTIYIVLGILYESLVHPVTILSTLPAAGVGALLTLRLAELPFTIIALIGVILLMGIVMKNAIMMIDFAVTQQRTLGVSAGTAMYRACLRRVRPILMTTVAALFGLLPLAFPEVFGGADGAELRRPLGIAVVGGLIMSQWLTLFTTPVVYLVLERLRRFRFRRLSRPALPQVAAAT